MFFLLCVLLSLVPGNYLSKSIVCSTRLINVNGRLEHVLMATRIFMKARYPQSECAKTS
ncbi:hypothetical protein Lalb_Chr10g0104631 [Lupinus albus]|uniref:Uncharacterized protein n=1 Tax=Lupinus albus TaxID=3870 RepID=A0A6A4PX61_LUPAL|nr:hypothetical protein Lalb_Chr10g0104631 [Lupinus albus]